MEFLNSHEKLPTQLHCPFEDAPPVIQTHFYGVHVIRHTRNSVVAKFSDGSETKILEV